MTEARDSNRESETEALRRINTMLHIWRLCGNAARRRSRACRGRPHRCAKRNTGALPGGVRKFLVAFLAAKYAGIDFERFCADMEGREETRAFFDWRDASVPRTGANPQSEPKWAGDAPD